MSIPLESEKRLSESMLWEMQTKAYQSFGADAWGTKGVPSYITSNPYIAKQYAEMALAYIRDGLSSKQIDLSKTFYLFDLGAGTGRFGYYFLKQLLGMLQGLDLSLQVCYVMTDFTSTNIDFLRKHPYLKQFIETGYLDFALYRHDDLTPLKLLESGVVLASSDNPIIVIANYFFDTIPQDLFRATNGTLEEGRICLTLPQNAETNGLTAEDVATIMHLENSYAYVPASSASYYRNPLFDAILDQYVTSLPQIPFLFPLGAFQTIDYFRKLSQDRLLLLAADQGYCTEADLRQAPEPYISKHSSFSIPVNYDAIGKYFSQIGGETLFTEFRDPTFVVTASILAKQSSETRLVFRQQMDAFGPAEYFALATYTDQEWGIPNLEKMLLLIKLGRWDASNFNEFFERIKKEALTASDSLKQHLKQVIAKVWEEFYPVNPKEALFVMNLGVLLYEMKDREGALLFFQRALEIDPRNVLILKNLASCYRSMGQSELAREYTRRALCP